MFLFSSDHKFPEVFFKLSAVGNLIHAPCSAWQKNERRINQSVTVYLKYDKQRSPYEKQKKKETTALHCLRSNIDEGNLVLTTGLKT